MSLPLLPDAWLAPFWLRLTLPLALAALFALRPWKRPRGRRVAAAALVVVGGALVLVDLAAPQRDLRTSRRQRWALLVDVSPSRTAEDQRRQDALLEQTRRAVGGVVQLERIDVGADGPAARGEARGDAFERTTLTPALLAARGADRALLLSDGRLAESPDELAALARRVGVPIDVPRHLPAPRRALTLGALELERAPGAKPGLWSAVARASHPTRVTVVVAGQRAGGELTQVSRRTRTLLPGVTRLTGRLPRVEPGQYLLHVALLPAAATTAVAAADAPLTRQLDAAPRGTRRVAAFEVGQPARVLVACADPGSELIGALRAGWHRIDVVAPDALPTRLEALLPYRAVVLAGAELGAVPRRAAWALTQYVRRRGGGLLLLDGRGPLSSDAWTSSPLAPLFPLTPRPPEHQPEAPPAEPPPPDPTPRERERPRRRLVARPAMALVVLIDVSGSMNGELAYDQEKARWDASPGEKDAVARRNAARKARAPKLVRACEAAEQALDALYERDPRDLFGVLAFNSRAAWIVKPIPARHRDRIGEAIRTLRADGDTDIHKALRTVAAHLGPLDCPVKHVLLISDGHTGPATFEKLVTDMALRKITVSTIGVGEHFDHRRLSDIARWGRGNFTFTNDADTVARLVIKETAFAARLAIPHREARRRQREREARERRRERERDQRERDQRERDQRERDQRERDERERNERERNERERDEGTHDARGGALRLLVRAPFLAGAWPLPEVGHVPACDPRPGATTFVATRDHRPVIAAWRNGPGRVALVAADATGEHGGRWRGWKHLPRLLSQLVGYCLADERAAAQRLEHHLALTARTGTPRAILDLWATDPTGAPWTGPLVARDLATGLSLGDVRPLGPGWHRITHTVRRPAIWSVSAGDSELTIAVDPPDPPTDERAEERLHALARASNGRIGVAPEQLLGLPFERERHAPWAPGLPSALGASALALAAALWRISRPSI